MRRTGAWKIAIYGADHGIPHFHVEGPSFRCSLAIATRELIVGDAPSRILAEARGWAEANEAELMAGAEPMSATDTLRTIKSAEATGPATLRLVWSDGAAAEVDLGAWLEQSAFAALRDPTEFGRVEIGDWGHSLEWPSGVEAGADSLWLETLSSTRRQSARAFVEWRLKHGLSLTGAAEALGLSRRMVAYYSNGEKPVPKTVLLACRGWEAANRPKRNRRAPANQPPALVGVAEAAAAYAHSDAAHTPNPRSSRRKPGPRQP